MLTYATASKPSGASTAVSEIARRRRIRSTRNVRRSSRRWSCAARYQRPEWTTRPCGLSSRRVSSPENARYVPANSAPPPDGVGQEEHRVARTGALRRAREVKSSVASSASTRRRSPSGRTRWIFASAPSTASARARQPEPSRRLHAERDRHRLVVREHERRQPVSGPDAVAAADAALALDRDAELLQRLDVAAHRSRVDLEPVGDLAARDERLRLEELEQLEQPGGRREHARSQAQIEGRIRPISTIAFETPTTTWRCDVTAAVKERATSPDFDFWMGKWNVHNRRLAQRLAGSDEWDEFESKVAARPLPGGLGNEDVFCTEYGGGFVGMSFRFFDPDTGRWSIYWADSRRPGLLDPPVIGSFSGDVGSLRGRGHVRAAARSACASPGRA